MSNDKLIEAIEHYQRNLARGMRDGNNTKVMHCIFKLSNMPITTSHLEETGIGRTVNAMRKMDGEIGDAARTLVSKWKQMVSQNQDCDGSTQNSSNESTSKSDSSHSRSDKARNTEKRRTSGSENEEDSDSSSAENNFEDNEEKSSDNKTSASELEDEEDFEESSSKPKRSRHESPPPRRKKEEKSSSSSKDRNGKHRDKDRKEKRREEDRKNRRKADEHMEKDCDRSSERNSKNSSPKSDRKRDKEKSSKDHSSSSSGKRKRDKSEERSSRNDSKHKDKNSASSSSSKSSKHHSEESEKASKHSSSKEKDASKKKEDKSKSKSTSSSEKRKSSSTEEKSKVIENGISSECGTSFAEALGMLEPSTSKKRPKTDKVTIISLPEKPKEDKERKKYKEAPRESKEKPKDRERSPAPKIQAPEIVLPPPPVAPLPKGEIDITSLLPAITPNYKPMANPMFDFSQQRSKLGASDDALAYVMSQKNQRTKVYSGNKCGWSSVPTLFEMCIRILQDNIDALEYTGGVPYAILKPVLDKATPQQLYSMEHYNAYLMEDTDEIWKFHCQREFKTKRREELESWRDMYMRCLDEREAKLKALTENIKQAQDKSTPVRQTKLAYMDSIVKPPRDIARKQAKNGVEPKRPLVTPQQRLNAIASGSSGAVSVPNPARAASSGSSGIKPKKAPLMQKTLAFLKGGRFRR